MKGTNIKLSIKDENGDWIQIKPISDFDLTKKPFKRSVYICPFRKHKFDDGRLAAFYLCKINSTLEESIIIYRNEWENQGGE